MAPSEWTPSIRAIRDTPVEDESVASVNTTRRVAYPPPIEVALCLLNLSVSYCNLRLWGCGQLWPYIQMCSLGMHLHRDCKAIGDAAKGSRPVAFTCVENAILSLLIIHIIPSYQIYVAIENPSLVPSVSCDTTISYLWNSVRAADDVSHADNWQSNRCHCFSHMNKCWDGIQVTRVFTYCFERQG